MNIPIGYRFQPNDEELIRAYLLPRIMGFPLPWNGILEKDVYAGEPWKVFSDVDDSSFYWNTNGDGDGTKKTIYVFTKVTKKTSKSKRVARRAGCGTWSGQTGPKIIKNSTTGDIVGYTKMLSFNKSEGDAKKLDLGHWIMHEYFLDGAALMEIGQRSNDLVLCKITKCANDRLRIPQFSFPAIDEFGIPANIGGESRNKRPAEELHGEEFGYKRQKSCGDCATNIGGDESLQVCSSWAAAAAADLQFCSSWSDNNDIQISTTTGNSSEFWHQQENGAMLDWDFDVPIIDDLFEGVEDDCGFFDVTKHPNHI